MKKYKCLKNDDSGWLDISECYVGILEVGELYFAEEYNCTRCVGKDFLRVYVGDRIYPIKKSWFEEI